MNAWLLLAMLVVGLAVGLAVGRSWPPSRHRVEHLLNPLQRTLDQVAAQLVSVDRDRAASQAALFNEIGHVRRSSEQLRGETASLVHALRKPQARGQWGEMQLRRVVELAGMVERCDFDVQRGVRTADGLRRPDLVIRLPEGRRIVVDAKVSLAAFLEAVEAGDESVQADRLRAHARHLREHVDALAGKAYWSMLSPTPEFVVLFVPGEAFLAPALESDPALLEHAFAGRVHIATPTTLISLLRTSAYGWQQAALGDNAHAVLDLGKELYRRLSTFGTHLDKVGRSLGSAITHYNAAVGSLERTVLVPARRLRDLDVTSDELTGPVPIREATRPLAAPELVASEEGRLQVFTPPFDPTGKAANR